LTQPAGAHGLAPRDLQRASRRNTGLAQSAIIFAVLAWRPHILPREAEKIRRMAFTIFGEPEGARGRARQLCCASSARKTGITQSVAIFFRFDAAASYGVQGSGEKLFKK